MTDGEMIALTGTLSTVAMAAINTVGSIIMLFIRAKYKYPEQSGPTINNNGIRDLSATAKHP